MQAEVLTVAGSGEKGLSDGPARTCKFCYPHDVQMHALNEVAPRHHTHKHKHKRTPPCAQPLPLQEVEALVAGMPVLAALMQVFIQGLRPRTRHCR